jgi:hypothetical protein
MIKMSFDQSVEMEVVNFGDGQDFVSENSYAAEFPASKSLSVLHCGVFCIAKLVKTCHQLSS